MGMGFGISSDDVLAVALNKGVRLTEDHADRLFDDLDEDAVEEAALIFEGLDAQTSAAHEEIWSQIQGDSIFQKVKDSCARSTLAESLPRSAEKGKTPRL